MSQFIHKASGLARGNKPFDPDNIIGAIRDSGSSWSMVSNESEMLDVEECVFGTDPYEIAIQIQEATPVPANCIKVVIPEMDTKRRMIEVYEYPVYMSITADIDNIIEISKEHDGVYVSAKWDGLKEERFLKECILDDGRNARNMGDHIEGVTDYWPTIYLVQYNPTKAKRKFSYNKNKDSRAKKSGEIDCFQISYLARTLIKTANSFLGEKGLSTIEFAMIKGGKNKAENMLNVANIIKAFEIFEYTDYRLNEDVQKGILKFELYVEGLISRKGMKTKGSKEKYELGCALKGEIAAIKKIQRKKKKDEIKLS